MLLTAISTDDQGNRVELELKVPDTYDVQALDTGEARQRLELMLRREVERATMILIVARKDSQVPRTRAAHSVTPTQVAFAGSKEPAVEVPSSVPAKKGR